MSGPLDPVSKLTSALSEMGVRVRDYIIVMDPEAPRYLILHVDEAREIGAMVTVNEIEQGEAPEILRAATLSALAE